MKGYSPIWQKRCSMHLQHHAQTWKQFTDQKNFSNTGDPCDIFSISLSRVITEIMTSICMWKDIFEYKWMWGCLAKKKGKKREIFSGVLNLHSLRVRSSGVWYEKSSKQIPSSNYLCIGMVRVEFCTQLVSSKNHE